MAASSPRVNISAAVATASVFHFYISECIFIKSRPGHRLNVHFCSFRAVVTVVFVVVVDVVVVAVVVFFHSPPPPRRRRRTVSVRFPFKARLVNCFARSVRPASPFAGRKGPGPGSVTPRNGVRKRRRKGKRRCFVRVDAPFPNCHDTEH